MRFMQCRGMENVSYGVRVEEGGDEVSVANRSHKCRSWEDKISIPSGLKPREGRLSIKAVPRWPAEPVTRTSYDEDILEWRLLMRVAYCGLFCFIGATSCESPRTSRIIRICHVQILKTHIVWEFYVMQSCELWYYT